MLKSLKLEGIGPVDGLTANFGERLNVLTGDNGLGKSFLLDVCFWALTGSWPGERVAIPSANGKKPAPSITFEVQGKSKSKKDPKTVQYEFRSQSWPRPSGRPFKPGLVIYASVDGSFGVWDPARNYWKADEENPRAYHFTPATLAEGLRITRENMFDSSRKTLCAGLLQDWETWYLEKNQPGATNSQQPFRILEQVIQGLSHPLEPMACVAPKQLFVDDKQRFPVMRLPYGDVAYPHWSAGMRRIISFAYLLVWTWHEHLQAAVLRGEEPENRIVLIVDEIEAHLHPKWQRTILPAILQVVHSLQKESVEVQVFAATHSPLILASLEPHFDTGLDKLFWFELESKSNQVRFHDYPWAIQGDVVGWLTNEIFGLKQARSREGEAAIEAAEAFMRQDTKALPPTLNTKAKIQQELARTLPGMDPFWPRWIVETKK